MGNPSKTFLCAIKKLGRIPLSLRRLISSSRDQKSLRTTLADVSQQIGVTIADPATLGVAQMPRFRRYLSGRPREDADYLGAAVDYVANKQSDEASWLYSKPYDRGPGNGTFYTETFQSLNLLRAMNVPHRGKILEVGSGPGWLTEILVALGFEVHGLDPSADMIAIARERVTAAIGHWRFQDPPPLTFHCQTLEDCTLPADDYDAVLFHASLHHVIDEEAGLAQCFRVLRPGGVLGVCEGAWEPGNTALETALDDEMARFGTLENPYTRDYLDYLLRQHGFTTIQRYHSINGFVPEAMGSATVESLADMPARSSNNLTALKPGLSCLTTRHHAARTTALIRVLQVDWIPGREALRVRLRLVNTGETTWLHKASPTGQVTVALRMGSFGAADYQELARHDLPADVDSGQEITLDLEVDLPEGGRQRAWTVDLVNEGVFWFSTRGTKAVPLLLPEAFRLRSEV